MNIKNKLSLKEKISYHISEYNPFERVIKNASLSLIVLSG
ncbi:hypothetical protein LLB_0288 [Legionella longbeachae D-4968]|nr:hypothetical protein LLB_0288 [Legionella longbeachae D-4968]